MLEKGCFLFRQREIGLAGASKVAQEVFWAILKYQTELQANRHGR
jgi:hypothetical protein